MRRRSASWGSAGPPRSRRRPRQPAAVSRLSRSPVAATGRARRASRPSYSERQAVLRPREVDPGHPSGRRRRVPWNWATGLGKEERCSSTGGRVSCGDSAPDRRPSDSGVGGSSRQARAWSASAAPRRNSSRNAVPRQRGTRSRAATASSIGWMPAEVRERFAERAWSRGFPDAPVVSSAGRARRVTRTPATVQRGPPAAGSPRRRPSRRRARRPTSARRRSGADGDRPGKQEAGRRRPCAVRGSRPVRRRHRRPGTVVARPTVQLVPGEQARPHGGRAAEDPTGQLRRTVRGRRHRSTCSIAGRPPASSTGRRRDAPEAGVPAAGIPASGESRCSGGAPVAFRAWSDRWGCPSTRSSGPGETWEQRFGPGVGDARGDLGVARPADPARPASTRCSSRTG